MYKCFITPTAPKLSQELTTWQRTLTLIQTSKHVEVMGCNFRTTQPVGYNLRAEAAT